MNIRNSNHKNRIFHVNSQFYQPGVVKTNINSALRVLSFIKTFGQCGSRGLGMKTRIFDKNQVKLNVIKAYTKVAKCVRILTNSSYVNGFCLCQRGWYFVQHIYDFVMAILLRHLCINWPNNITLSSFNYPLKRHQSYNSDISSSLKSKLTKV